MMDFDNSSVSEECAMVCTDIPYEDLDKDIIMYGDQGVNTEEHNEAMYGKLTKTGSKEEEKVNYNVSLCANDSMSLERKGR